MRHGSLFSGIGGFDLAAEWMGWENVFHCEWMPFPRKILEYYWPKAISYENICTTDFSVHRGAIDIITGGFPCQPYSSAGKRLGKEDERHLWPEMLRAIREIEPSWVVGENVRGLTNWNGGVVFEEVCADLENLGYEVQPVLLPAASVNAPHRRDRIWFVAHTNATNTKSTGLERANGQRMDGTKQPTKYTSTDSDSNGQQQCDSQYEKHTSKGRLDAFGDIDKSNGNGDATDTESERTREQSSENKRWEDGRFNNISETWNASNTCNEGLQRSEDNRSTESIRKKSYKQFTGCLRTNWENFPTQSPICNGDDGLSSRLDSITFPKWRNESIKGGGNAIVPQVALQLFKVIQELSINQ